MYGFGSKKALLEDFASTALVYYTVFVVNGYLQTISIKQVTLLQMYSSDCSSKKETWEIRILKLLSFFKIKCS